MSTSAASTLIARIQSMPTLPTIALRVIEVTSNPDSSANDLMRIISPDVSLTIKILKIANSPFYGLTREISSLQHALTVLGFTEIRNLVISTVAFESFKGFKQDGKFDIGKFWKHSFCCGLAAKLIATDLKNSSNELFVAGLVHDIGKLAMYLTFPVEFMTQVEIMSPLKIKYTAFEAERGVFGMTHDEVGMKLLERWMFPKNLITAVGFHHRPQEAGEKSNYPLIVHIADILTHVYEMDEDEDEDEDDPIDEELFYDDIISMSRSYGINWEISDMCRLQEALAKCIREESDTMKLFF
ncbi:MAG: HDOD domain-containing protein [Candidatus Brocadiaceae bacterium]|nr:HDOD domain-containing protein [Candidatus Brocadiaceae bacterium]